MGRLHIHNRSPQNVTGTIYTDANHLINLYNSHKYNIYYYVSGGCTVFNFLILYIGLLAGRA